MRQIKPISIWKNGQEKEASILNATIAFDNLESTCNFQYELCSGGQGTEQTPLISVETLADGILTLRGQNYLDWNGDNDFAYAYIAEKLNLTLIETT
jgi:hypothetical protein